MKKQFLVSLFICAVYVILSLVPLPGVDVRFLREAFGPSFRISDLWPISILAIGYEGYASAFLWMATFSLFLPKLIRLRQKGYAGWLRLERYGVVFILLVVAIWGNIIASSLLVEASQLPSLIRIANVVLFRTTTVLTLLAGSFLTVRLIWLVRERGFGHGVSLFILVKIFLIQSWENSAPEILLKELGAPSKLLLMVFGLGLIAGMVWLLRYRLVGPTKTFDGENSMAVVLNPLPAGIVAWAVFLSLMEMISLLPESPLLFRELWFQSVFLATFSLLLGWLFNRYQWPSRTRMKQVNLLRNATFWKSQAIGFLAVWVLAIGLPILLEWKRMPMILDFFVVFILVAIALDLFLEGRLFLKHSEIAKVAVFQQVIHADGAAKLLAEEGIPFVIRARNHRALFHFWGFFLEMTLLVPTSHVGEVKSLIETNFPWATYHEIPKNA